MGTATPVQALFSHIDQDRIDEVWASIAPGLESIGAGPGFVDTVRRDCISGISHLFVVDTGFFVVRPVFDDDHNRLELLVVAAVTHTPKRGNVARYQPLIEALARKIGAKAVVTRSNRAGMARLLGPRWAESHTEYVMEISDG